MDLIRFMSSTAARPSLVVTGFALVVAGLAIGGGGVTLALIGFIALLAGMFGFRLLAPPMGQPFKGR